MGVASGYITRRLPPHLRFLRRKQPSVQFIARPGTLLVPIYQGTEFTKVTEYVPFLYFTHTVSMETSSIRPCYDVDRLETKTHVGLGPGYSIDYLKHRVSLEVHPWVSSRKCYLASMQLWTDQAKRGLNNAGQVNPKRLLFKQKGLWPAKRGHLGCKTLQMWMARTSQPPHKCLKWTPRWTMPKTRRCLWWNGLWLRWGTATLRRSTLMW